MPTSIPELTIASRSCLLAACTSSVRVVVGLGALGRAGEPLRGPYATVMSVS
jgi:hypothetical protein